MRILPVNPAENASPGALRDFLEHCAVLADDAGGPGQVVSISIAVDSLDPLAVLESIYESDQVHFYAERPSQGFGVAGADALLCSQFWGPERFQKAKSFIEGCLRSAIAVGPVGENFGGPHFFVSGCFAGEQVDLGHKPFLPMQVLLPRWQVSRMGDGSVAVANLLIRPGAPLDTIAEKLWKAHAKFRSFDYRAAKNKDRPSAPMQVNDVGPVGGYQQAVRQALVEINRGDYQKIVLARAKQLTTAEAFHPLGVLNHLRQRFPGCYAFSVANGRGQSFIGASPERLVRVAGGRMHTEALAGSAPRGDSASEDAALARGLQQSEKDQREHRIVIESIARRVADLGLKLEHSDTPRVLGLANVQHLHTPISAALPAGTHILDLVERLHPTPAVGGSPRAAALPAIARLEGFERGLYAGPIGWVNHLGEGEFFVGIRSALVDGRTATVYAGAGIVAGSSPEKEFAETELKFRALIGALTQS